MSELKMVKVCPTCDSSSLLYRSSLDNYRCHNCNLVFKAPVIRPSKKTPSANTPKPLELVNGIKMLRACPTCDSTYISYRTRQNNFRCNLCGSKFEEPKIRPAHRQTLHTAQYKPEQFIEILDRESPSTIPYIRKHLNCARYDVARYIAELERDKKVKRVEIRGGSPAWVRCD